MIATEREHLMRDLNSKALINKDTNLYRQRQAAKLRDARIQKIETDMMSLNNELREIKDLLASIVNRN
jgi:hypothetical protein